MVTVVKERVNMTDEEPSAREPLRIAVVSAGLSEPSTTTKLGNAVASRAVEYLREHGRRAEITTIILKDLARQIATASASFQRGDDLVAAMRMLSSCDGVVAASPVFQASYSGLFKSFWDVAERDLMLNRPVALVATAGSERHALVPDTAMRALFAFLHAVETPTAIMAADNDWGAADLDSHIAREGRELGALILSGVRGLLMQATAGLSTRSFDAYAGDDGDDDAHAPVVSFETTLMRLAAGGLSSPSGSPNGFLSPYEVDDARPSEPDRPAKHGKTRHRWSAEVAAIEFHLDAFESRATVVWRGRTEMVIAQGAVMRREPPLNKDGSLGYSARFGQRIRSEHSGQFRDFVTTEDIVLRSVNEVGLFLYFGGTNGWLQLRDARGRTLDEWTAC